MKLAYSFLLLCVLTLSSCLPDSYSDVPQIADPNLPVNYTIQQLKDAYRSSGQTVMSISGDYTIKAIVTADDRSGNFYKEIVIQDGSAAIGVQIDRSNLYNDFPIGRQIYIKLQGMAISSSDNLIKLGGYVDTVSVPGARQLGYVISSQIPRYIVKGTTGNKVDAEEVSISSLTDAYQYKLIKLKNVEFDCTNVGATYADAVGLNDANRTLNACSGGNIIIRSSGYSSFAASKVAPGNGDLIAIYTVFRTTKQLKLRELADLTMDSTSTRCVSCGGGGGGGGGGGNPTLIDIATLRGTYAGSGVKIGDNFIEGTVISDKDNKNTDGRNMILQDATGGLAIRFTANHTFAVGDKVKLTFVNDSLTKFNGLMQVNNFSLADATKIGTGTISPQVITITQLRNSFSQYESELIQLAGVTISGGSTFYSGTSSGSSRTVSDGTANVTMWTLSGATFAGTTIPSGSRTVTAIAGYFGTSPQIILRSAADVQ